MFSQVLTDLKMFLLLELKVYVNFLEFLFVALLSKGMQMSQSVLFVQIILYWLIGINYFQAYFRGMRGYTLYAHLFLEVSEPRISDS
jgi:uncharacterized RDD family membrane protein YckC